MRREQVEDEQKETCWEMKTEGVHIKEILYLITKILLYGSIYVISHNGQNNQSM